MRDAAATALTGSPAERVADLERAVAEAEERARQAEERVSSAETVRLMVMAMLRPRDFDDALAEAIEGLGVMVESARRDAPSLDWDRCERTVGRLQVALDSHRESGAARIPRPERQKPAPGWEPLTPGDEEAAVDLARKDLRDLDPLRAAEVLLVLKDAGRIHGQWIDVLHRAQDVDRYLNAHFGGRHRLAGRFSDAYCTAWGDLTGLDLLHGIALSIADMDIDEPDGALVQEQVRSDVAWVVHGDMAAVARGETP